MVEAKLIKRKTGDGLMEMEDHIPLGKIYRVDLDSKRMVKGFNLLTYNWWEREMVKDILGGELPTELLEIEDAKQC